MRKLLLTTLFIMFAVVSWAQQPALIPSPKSVEWGNGTYTLHSKTSIGYGSPSLKAAASYLQKLLGRPTGYAMPVKAGRATISLSLERGGMAGSYRLHVSRQGIDIVGADYNGVVNGIATLRQLLPDDIDLKGKVPARSWTVPYVSIADAPRFEWRGMMLDCSRHFFSKAEVMELLDVLALYKINKLHWHLTDDQGWRIEIKKYPLLTQKGGWRTYNDQDRICINRAKAEDEPSLFLDRQKTRIEANGDTVYGGFYTQQDVREIVRYAGQRGIDVIPEIDMPGHSMMAILNYKGLSCFEKFEWGKIFSAPMCPGKDRMLEFCKDVWSEVFQLFPYKYVHIGGDEVDMVNWKKCPDCQRRMADNGLKTEAELQTWFNHYMEKFFTAHGKQMIGWDEIIEGGLSKTSTVMWWRSWKPQAPKQATSHGNRFICTPNTQFYFDYTEDHNALGKIFDFDPLGGGLTEAEKKLVMGVQGNLWSEWIPTRQRLFHMAFPRMLAVAELGWAQPEKAKLADFKPRLVRHFDRLRKMDVAYRTPDLTGFYNRNVFVDKATVKVECDDPSAIIRYTTDGSMPQSSSARYEGPFTIDKATDFIFRSFKGNGQKDEMVHTSYVKEALADAVEDEPRGKGLYADWFDYDGPRCEGIEDAPMKKSFTVDKVAIPEGVSGNIGLIFNGYINVPADGIYTFFLASDDGSWLMIDDVMVVDNNKEQSLTERVGQHAMKKGLHWVEVRYFDHNGGTLKLRMLDKDGKEMKPEFWLCWRLGAVEVK